MLPECSIYYQATLVLKKNVKSFSVRGKFSRQLPMRDSHYSPFLLPETPGFSELLWAPTPGPPLRLCSGDLTAPPDPQLARAMIFACQNDIIINPTNCWWWWFEGRSHEIFKNREGGPTIYLLLPGRIKNLAESFIPFLQHPPPPPPPVS